MNVIIAAKDGQVREVKRRKRGRLWCPWCDHSANEEAVQCALCGAAYTTHEAGISQVPPAPIPSPAPEPEAAPLYVAEKKPKKAKGRR